MQRRRKGRGSKLRSGKRNKRDTKKEKLDGRKKGNVPKTIKRLGKMSKTKLAINAKLKKHHRERIRSEMFQNESIQNNQTG